MPLAVFLYLCLYLAACGKNGAEVLADAGAQYKARRFADAEIGYRKAIQLDPQSGPAHYGLGRALLDQQKASEAYPALKRAVELMPGDADARRLLENLALAAYLADERRPNELYTLLQRLAKEDVEKNPTSFEGWRIRGFLARTDRKQDEAVDAFRRALSAQPLHADTTRALAQTLFAGANTAQEGEKLLRELIAAHPDDGPSYDFLLQRLIATEREAEAEELLKKKVSANPAQGTYAIQLAEFYRRLGRQEDASEVVARLATSDKGRLHVGDYYLRSGAWEKALAEYREGYKIAGPEQIVYAKRMLSALNSLGRMDEARQVADEALKAAPKDLDLRTARALLDIEQRRFDEAVTRLRALTAEQPSSAALHFHLGRALAMKADAVGARAAWQQAMRLNPKFIEPRLAMATQSLRSGKAQDALREVEAVLQFAPNNQVGLLTRVAVLQEMGKLDEARSALQQLQDRYPDAPGLDVEQAFLSLRARRFAEAEALFRKRYLPGQENLRPLTGLIQTLGSTERVAEAIRILEADLRTLPGRAPVQYLLADAYVRAGDTEKATGMLSELHRSHPEMILAGLRLAELQSRGGAAKAALATLEQVRKVSPKAVEPLVMQAQIHERSGATELAKKSYREVLVVDESNLFALNGLAYLVAEGGAEGELQDALRMATAAQKKVPNDPNVADTLALVRLRLKDTAAAAATFRELATKAPGNALFRFHLGLALKESGDLAGAKREFAAALQAKPDAGLAEKVNVAMRGLSAR